MTRKWNPSNVLFSFAPMPSILGLLGLTAQWICQSLALTLWTLQPNLLEKASLVIWTYFSWLCGQSRDIEIRPSIMTQQTCHPRFGNQREGPYLIIKLLVLTLSQLILLHAYIGLHHHQDSIRSTLMAQLTTGEATLALELSLRTPQGPLLELLARSSPLASMQKLLKPMRCTKGSFLLWKCR